MNKYNFQSGALTPIIQFIVVIALLLTGLPSYSQSLSPEISPEIFSDLSLELYDNDDPSTHGFSPELLSVRTLIKANVLNLAQVILETEGPPALPNKAWLDWERQLWKLYRVRENWQGLYQRARQIPPTFPQKIHKEADIQAIYALIEQHDGKSARVLLRKHLLADDLLEFVRRRFRKLLIESYLADDLLADAGVAMKNYQSDFNPSGEDWLLLSAKIYRKHNYPESAATLLATVALPSAQLLRIFLRLESQTIDPVQAISEAKLLLSAQSAVKSHQILAVIIYAKHSSALFPPAVDELEQYLITIGDCEVGDCEIGDGVSETDDVYPQYNIADLLVAYKETALAELAQPELLDSDNLELLDYVIQLPAEEIARKKVISGYLLQNLNDRRLKDQFIRQKLNDLFITSLIESERIDIIPQIYGADKSFGTLTLSGDVGLKLSNSALTIGNIRLAAEVNQALTELPQGMERADWLLHTVRISIIAGDYDKGVNDLMLLIEEFDVLEPEQTDRMLQPIFDLQTANQHELALKLLEAVNTRSHSAGHRREIAYWIAESYQATHQYIKAANYFLFSALQKKDGFDQWGESARYNAAEALLSANLISDSRGLFEGLLTRASTDSRKTQLKRKLQELRLHESRLNSVE